MYVCRKWLSLYFLKSISIHLLNQKFMIHIQGHCRFLHLEYIVPKILMIDIPAIKQAIPVNVQFIKIIVADPWSPANSKITSNICICLFCKATALKKKNLNSCNVVNFVCWCWLRVNRHYILVCCWDGWSVHPFMMNRWWLRVSSLEGAKNR